MPEDGQAHVTQSSGGQTETGFEKARETKIAIIGAGIAGLYCGYRLDMEGKGDFLIAEASSHIGGRIWTARILDDGTVAPDGASLKGEATKGFTVEVEDPKKGRVEKRVEFCAEFGPMRIELELQEYLHCVLMRLGLKEDVQEFAPYKSPISDHDPKYELKGEECEQETPLDLLKLAMLRIMGRLRAESKTPADAALLQEKLDCLVQRLSRATATRQGTWKTILLQWLEELGEPHYQAIREYGVLDDGRGHGSPLWEMGFWNLLSEVLSHHALMKLRDLGTFYHLIPENPNAAEWLIFWLRGLRTSSQLVGIRGGMQRITEKLKEAIEGKKKDRISANRRLVGIAPADDGRKVKLTFEKIDGTGKAIQGVKETWLGEHVILALPRGPLQDLVHQNAGSLYRQLDRDLASVIGFPLIKVFFSVKERWWSENAAMTNRFATLVPTRELHYWLSSESRRGLVMIYSDRPASSFWSNYIKHSPATEGLPSGVQFAPETGNGNDNLRLVHKVLQYLEENGVTRKVGDMEFYGIRDWGREPYRGAAHAWYPERKSSEFLRRLSAFGIGDYDCDHHMSPKHERNIHICGEAYSDYQAFIEGALRSSEHVLHCIDREAFPETPTPWLCDKPCVHEKGPQLPEQFRTLMDAAAKAAQHPSPETR